MAYGCSAAVAVTTPVPVYCIGSETWEVRVFLDIKNVTFKKRVKTIISRCFERRFNLVFLYTETPRWKSRCDLIIQLEDTRKRCTVLEEVTDISRLTSIIFPNKQVHTMDILHSLGHVLGLPHLPGDFWLQYPRQQKEDPQQTGQWQIFEDSVMRFHDSGQDCFRPYNSYPCDLFAFDIDRLLSMYGGYCPGKPFIEHDVFYVFALTE